MYLFSESDWWHSITTGGKSGEEDPGVHQYGETCVYPGPHFHPEDGWLPVCWAEAGVWVCVFRYWRECNLSQQLCCLWHQKANTWEMDNLLWGRWQKANGLT